MTVTLSATRIFLPLACICSLLFSISSYAVPFSFVQNSVMAELSEDEVSSFKSTIRETLDASPDAKVIEWASPNGKRKGKILPKLTYQTGGKTCRRTSFQLSDEKGLKENYRFDLCKSKKGWQVEEGPKRLSKTANEDLQHFLNTVLNGHEIGHPITWRDPDSGHSVVAVVLADDDNVPSGCHKTALNLADKKGKNISGQYLFCLNDTGGWDYRANIEH